LLLVARKSFFRFTRVFKTPAGGEPGFDSEKFFKLRLEQYRTYRAAGERALDALRGTDVDCGLPFFRRLASSGLFHGFLQERAQLQVFNNVLQIIHEIQFPDSCIVNGLKLPH